MSIKAGGRPPGGPTGRPIPIGRFTTIRAAFHVYTTEADVDMALAALSS